MGVAISMGVRRINNKINNNKNIQKIKSIHKIKNVKIQKKIKKIWIQVKSKTKGKSSKILIPMMISMMMNTIELEHQKH